MTMWVLREPSNGIDLEWFSIGKPLYEYEQNELIPCTFYNDTQNKDFMFIKYIGRSELLTGNYRFYADIDALATNVSFKFGQTI